MKIAVLKQTLAHFQIRCQTFRYLCTCRLAKQVWPELPNHQLSTLANPIGHSFQHHHAQSDAEAAGRVLLAMMAHVKASSLDDLIAITGLEALQFGSSLLSSADLEA